MNSLLRISSQLEAIKNEMDVATETARPMRTKRDTSRYLNDVVQDIQSSLDKLEATRDGTQFLTPNDSMSMAKCQIQTGGSVNCSNSIYEDEKSWKKSRQQIDLLIQVLKTKIVELKDIRKHLKEHRPKNVTDSGEEETSGESMKRDSTESEAETTMKSIPTTTEAVSVTPMTTTPMTSTERSRSTELHHHGHRVRHHNQSEVTNRSTVTATTPSSVDSTTKRKKQESSTPRHTECFCEPETEA